MEQNSDPKQEILNFLQLDEFIGTGGQPTAQQFNFLQEAAYRVVINLALPSSENALTNEGSLVTGLGMTYIHIPVVWEKPKMEDFNQFAQIMQALQGTKVFIHCARNMRVSCFMYLYRTIYQQVPHNIARRDLLQIWRPNETWQAFIDAVHTSRIHLQGE
jgi:protein tyrosine phosphatase (PTP) superfamily phosphohydrolase (DUF442 family)